MKLTANRVALLHAAKAAAEAAASNTTKPILSCIRIDAFEDGRIVVSGTDLEVGVRNEFVGATAEKAGTIVVGQKLIRILQESNSVDVTLTPAKGGITIRLSDAKYELPFQDPDEFPEVPWIDTVAEPHYTVKTGDLRRAIRRTNFAAEKRENTRYAVTGLLFEMAENSTTLVATDTKRLSIDKIDAVGKVGAKPINGLIPNKTVKLIEHAFGLDDEEVDILITANEAVFRFDKTTIYSRLVEGRFPPYRQFLPKKTESVLKIKSEEFVTRARQAAVMADEETARLKIEIGGDKIVFRSQGQGNSEVEMPVEYSYETIQFAVDPKYLIEAARASGENIELRMTKPVDRILLIDGEWTHLLAPMSGGD